MPERWQALIDGEWVFVDDVRLHSQRSCAEGVVEVSVEYCCSDPHEPDPPRPMDDRSRPFLQWVQAKE